MLILLRALRPIFLGADGNAKVVHQVALQDGWISHQLEELVVPKTMLFEE